MTSKVRLAAKAKTTCHVTHALPYLFTKDLLHPNNRFLLQLIKLLQKWREKKCFEWPWTTSFFLSKGFDASSVFLLTKIRDFFCPLKTAAWNFKRYSTRLKNSLQSFTWPIICFNLFWQWLKTSLCFSKLMDGIKLVFLAKPLVS